MNIQRKLKELTKLPCHLIEPAFHQQSRDLRTSAEKATLSPSRTANTRGAAAATFHPSRINISAAETSAAAGLTKTIHGRRSFRD